MEVNVTEVFLKNKKKRIRKKSLQKSYKCISETFTKSYTKTFLISIREIKNVTH